MCLLVNHATPSARVPERHKRKGKGSDTVLKMAPNSWKKTKKKIGRSA